METPKLFYLVSSCYGTKKILLKYLFTEHSSPDVMCEVQQQWIRLQGPAATGYDILCLPSHLEIAIVTVILEQRKLRDYMS
jgi:hypothetical protein